MADVNWPYMMRRQGTAAWTADTVALLDGEIGWNSQTGELAVGDGTTLWPSLEKFVPNTGMTPFSKDMLQQGDPAAWLANLNAGSVGQELFGLNTPPGTRFLRINGDGTVSERTAAELGTDLGAGSSNGLATLDAGGKVPTSQLPDTILGQLEYVSGWNGATNTPAIPSASTSNKGEFYIVTTGVASGHGHANVPNVSFEVGDWLLSNGTSWEKILNSDAVTTVAGRIGAVVLTSADLTDRTTLGGNWFTMATPAGVRFARINADGTITQRTAAELLSDIGAQAAGSYLVAGNNLSDIGSASTARSNLGLGSIATINEVEVAVGSGQNTSSATPVDITGLSASLDANGRYYVEVTAMVESANVNTGVGLSLNGSAAASKVAMRFEGHQSAGNLTVAALSAYDAGTAAGTVAVINTPYYYELKALVTNGASASTLSARFFRGGSSNNITIQSARMKVRKLP